MMDHIVSLGVSERINSRPPMVVSCVRLRDVGFRSLDSGSPHERVLSP